MNLHANAALSLKGRRGLCLAVVERERTLAQAAEPTQTNGKAERFIRTLLCGWAYGAIYRSSTARTAALDGWLYHYNRHRKHSALGHQPPIARLNERNQP